MGKICHVAGCSGAAGFRQGAPAARERANAARAEAVKSAQASFLAAEAVGGEYSHPYPYYMAKEYFELAEHELNGGDIHGVIDFAEKSERYSAGLVRDAGGVAK